MENSQSSPSSSTPSLLSTKPPITSSSSSSPMDENKRGQAKLIQSSTKLLPQSSSPSLSLSLPSPSSSSSSSCPSYSDRKAQFGIKVLISMDASEQSRDALRFYMDHLHRKENELLVLHVVELPDVVQTSTSPISPGVLYELWNEECIKGQQLLEQCIDLLQSAGMTRVKSRLDNGMKPGHVVVNVATEEGAGMVVIGTRGAGLLRRTVIGSVSDYVVNHAHCPVVVCRTTTHDSKHQHHHHA